VMELTEDGALEQSEKRFDCIGVMEPTGPNVLVSAVIDAAMSLATSSAIGG
jgi:hypothetical protein